MVHHKINQDYQYLLSILNSPVKKYSDDTKSTTDKVPGFSKT